MADELLQLRGKAAQDGITPGFGGISGLLNATPDDLKKVKGLWPSKRAEIIAVLELARRAVAQQLQERTVLSDPSAVKHYLQLHLGQRSHEVFAVVFLDVQNKLLAMEEMFRGTLDLKGVADLQGQK